jgi:hypothetical protein
MYASWEDVPQNLPCSAGRRVFQHGVMVWLLFD